jgi:MFS family permease
MGLLLSSLVFGIISSSFSQLALLGFAWRIPFLLSIILVGVGLFIRLSIAETPDFERVKAERVIARVPLIEVLRTNLKTVVLAAGAFFVVNGAFYIYITFIVSYGARIKVPSAIMLNGTLIGAVAMAITIVVAGVLSDRIGRLPVYLTGAAFAGLIAFPLFWLVDTRSPLLIYIALALGIGGIGIMYGPQAAFFSELFGANIRYSGASLGYQITAIFAGGLAPFIATALLARFNNASWPIALYVIGMAVITFVCTYLAGETHPARVAQVVGGAGG